MAGAVLIEVIAGPGTGRRLVLARGAMARVGRGEDMELSVPDPSLAKRRVEIEHTARGVFVRERGARDEAKTYVGGSRVPRDGVRVAAGTIVKLGETQLRVGLAGKQKGPRGLVLEEKLGEGESGSVHSAWQDPPGRHVAVKIVNGLEDDRSRAARVQREVALQRRVDHPAIVRVHALLEHGGALYLVRELVLGESLDEVFRRGPLPWRRALAVGAVVADALARAHALGIIHRDVSPGNVFLERGTDAVRLTDFGLARDTKRREGTRLTNTSDVLGTWFYSAPEQFLEAKTAGPKADVYSLAAVLYHALSGKRPFGDTSWDDYARALFRGPEPLDAIAPRLKPAVRAAVTRALATAPEERPEAAEFARELARLGSA